MRFPIARTTRYLDVCLSSGTPPIKRLLLNYNLESHYDWVSASIEKMLLQALQMKIFFGYLFQSFALKRFLLIKYVKQKFKIQNFPSVVYIKHRHYDENNY